ncbi:hypothetical protein Tco_0129316 [Tanacetum coccineum]
MLETQWNKCQKACGNAEIEKNIEEAKSFVEDKDYAVKSAEDGTADLKKTVKELAKSLADYEKKLEVYVGLVTCVRAKLLKCCNDFEQVYVCTDKISGNEDKCLEDQLRDAKGDEAVALEKKLDIIQKDENIEKGLKFLAYDEGRMESIQKEWMVESEVSVQLAAHGAGLETSNICLQYIRFDVVHGCFGEMGTWANSCVLVEPVGVVLRVDRGSISRTYCGGGEVVDAGSEFMALVTYRASSMVDQGRFDVSMRFSRSSGICADHPFPPKQ